MTFPEKVRAFLGGPLPHAGSPQMRAWTKQAEALGPAAAPVMLEVLREGTPDEQSAALFALRYVGYEAWAEGYGGATAYRYRELGVPDWQVIHPRHPPQDQAPGGL